MYQMYVASRHQPKDLEQKRMSDTPILNFIHSQLGDIITSKKDTHIVA